MYLTRCRHCDSKLIQLEQLWLTPDGRQVAHRRCPECEIVDDVIADPRALWAWAAAERRHREAIERSVLELADGVAELEPLR
jgi:hypothetical protein